MPTANTKRIRRALLWLPCFLVALASLFAPEIAGVVSHLISNPTSTLGKYHIRMPITWVVGYRDKTDLHVISAPGVGRIGFGKYWHNKIPVSEMGFYPIPHPENLLDRNVPLYDTTILGKRSFAFGNQNLICWDLIHHYSHDSEDLKGPSMALIQCSSENENFYAYFFGWRGDSESFYTTLQEIKILK